MNKFITSLIILFFVSVSIYAELNPEEVKERMWSSQHKGSEVTEVPEKWKEESAVILYKSFEYEVKKAVMIVALYENSFYRYRIKLQDKAAVEEYSDFTFSKGFGYKSMWVSTQYQATDYAIKVIKPNGESFEVDTENAKDVEYDDEYTKIAIPNLEPGDIIDYYFVSQNRIGDNYFEAFDRQYYTFADEYPVLKQKVSINVMRKCYLNARSLNGAPELTDISPDDNKAIYEIELDDTEKVEDEIWNYYLRQYPTIKFQAIFATPGGKKSYFLYSSFMDKPKSKKSEITTNEVRAYVQQICDGSDFLDIAKHVKKNFKKQPVEVQASQAYYYLRNYYYERNYENAVLYDYNRNSGKSSRTFTSNLSDGLKKLKIDHDVLITADRDNTDIENLIFATDIEMLIRINTPDTMFICSGGRLAEYNFLPDNFQGNEAYCMPVKKKQYTSDIYTTQIPILDSETNKYNKKTSVNLNLENSELEMKIDNTVSGNLKFSADVLRGITFYDYIDECDQELYDNIKVDIDAYPKKKKAKLVDRQKTIKEDSEKKRLENIAEQVQGEYKLNDEIEVNDFEFKQSGMWHKKPELKYSFAFNSNEFLKKVGPNYLIEAGRLIGGQVDLDKDKERKSDIYWNCPRTYEDDIEIEIPEGYTVKGIEKFNYNIDNEFGSFISKAALKGNVLTVSSKKTYNKNFVEKENWNDILAFTAAASEFFEQKILLEKK